jgi:hypothetical protein
MKKKKIQQLKNCIINHSVKKNSATNFADTSGSGTDGRERSARDPRR